MIRKVIFDGFEAVEIITNAVRMVVVYQVGPRIAFFGKNGGNNILYWDKTNGEDGQWKIYGGHRVWITRPYADESVDTYAQDNSMCSLEISDGAVTVMAPEHEFTHLERGMQIRVLDDHAFEVKNIIRNAGNLIYSGGVWSPTCIDPEGTCIRIPIGQEDTTWDIVKIVIPRIFAGNRVLINDDQIRCTEEEMIIVPAGRVTKRCVKAPKGSIICECQKEGVIFTKHSHYVEDGRYPLDGCNIAAFVGKDNWMAEMETFGTEQSIKPGREISNTEIWTLQSCEK